MTRIYQADLPVLFFPDDRFGASFSESAAEPEMYQDGRFWMVVGGGHDPWFSDRETFFRVVRTFLEQHVQETPGSS